MQIELVSLFLQNSNRTCCPASAVLAFFNISQRGRFYGIGKSKTPQVQTFCWVSIKAGDGAM
jgi:hypothetical protein